jgi:putative SOS response-associated peptidase YedK
MCGRFTLTQSGQAIAQTFQLSTMPEVQPRYNIAPTQVAPVVLVHPDRQEREFQWFHWGLIPSWAKDTKMAARMINARAETVAEKPAFRAAFKRRRCLVVADGFYEWQQNGKIKQPYYFYVQQSTNNPAAAPVQLFAFAGLWEYWEREEGAIASCTILTTTANDLLRSIHDRMPVILPPKVYDRWLDPTFQRSDVLQSMLQPYPAIKMAYYPVNSTVNSARKDDPSCILPLQADV